MIKRFVRMTAASLVLIMMVSCFGAFAADIYTEDDLRIFHENIRFLSAFDLIEDNGRDAATTIKRGDLASIMLKYLGYDHIPYEGELFADVYDKTSAVYGMVQLGLVNGYPDGSFRPDADVLFEEAVKTLVAALGYHVKAESEGGYPSGYLSCARQIGLLKNTDVSYGKILTYFNFTKMLVNALSVDLMQRQNYNGTESYAVTPGDTWLSMRFLVEKRRGIVMAAQDTALNESGVSGKNTLSVDGVVYTVNGDYSYLVGSLIEFYANNDNEIKYIIEYGNTRQVFTPAQLQGYADKTYKADEMETGRIRDYRLSGDAYIIFNGAAAGSLSAEDMIPEYGTVTLIDNNNDGLYEVVWIESYGVYIVQNVDADDKRIFYENSGGSILEFKSITNVEVVNSAGTGVAFEQIPASSVIRVGFSKDGSKAKIIVSAKSIVGSVTQIEGGGKDAKVYIDGIPYRTVAELLPYEKFKVGMGGTFYLDAEDLIAAFTDDGRAYTYGYLLAAVIDGGLNEKLQLKVYDSLGQTLYLDCVNRMEIDGLTRQTPEQVFGILKKGTDSVLKQIIRFRRNSAGEVIEIDTPYNNAPSLGAGYLNAVPENGESPESLRLIYSGSAAYYAALYTFSGRVNVAASTPIINVSGETDKDFRIRRVSNLVNERSYNIEAYSDSEDERYAKLIFTGVNLDSIGGGVMGIVSGISQALNSDDEIVLKIKLETQGGSLEIFSETDLAKSYPQLASEAVYPIEIGDIIYCTHSNRNANALFMVYQRQTGIFPAGNPYGSLGTQDFRYVFARVYSKEQRYINLTTQDIIAGIIPAPNQMESHYVPASKAYKYSESGGEAKVTPATIADIIDYKTGGAQCSEVFALTHWSWPRMMVIY